MMKQPETLLDTAGVVVGCVDVGERDRLITLLTDTLGLVTVLAPSARQLKSRYLSSTEMMAYGKFRIAKRKDRYVLRDSQVINTFFGLRESIEKAALAAYICEVVSYTGTEEGDSTLLRFVLNTLYVLEKDKYPLRQIKATFELRYASHIGFTPDISCCALCERETMEGVLRISVGDMICEECRNTPEAREEGIVDMALVSHGTVHAMRYIVSAPWENIFSYKLEETDLRLLAHAAESYLIYHTDHMYTSLTFYKQVAES